MTAGDGSVKSIALDAMGGDLAPEATVKGALLAVAEYPVRVTLAGRRSRLEPLLGKGHPDILIHDCSEVIEADDQPVQAIRQKRDSSMVQCFGMVKEGAADAIVSAGNTGALLAGGLLILGRIRGIDRPALTVVLPGLGRGPFLLLDVGANTDVRARNLMEFAMMGSVYAERVMGVASPRIGLLNIGVEESKGTEQVRLAYGLLRDSGLNFVGNVEARDMFSGPADVIVSDGFVGNVLLKAVEGVALTLFSMIRKEAQSDMRSKAGALILRPYLKRVAAHLDYSEYGGAPVLGLAAPCIKCHGSSDEKAIKNGIGVALKFIEARVPEQVAGALTGQERKN
jgi:glycerol-3-phosphate acyltransferase PlsX